MTSREKAQLIVASNLSDRGSAKVMVENLIETIEVNLEATRQGVLDEIREIVQRRFDLNPNEGYYLNVEIIKIIKELQNED